MQQQEKADAPPEATNVTEPTEIDVQLDDLIEDVSIDGMCGVY